MMSQKRIAFITTSYPESDTDPAGHFVRSEVSHCEADGHVVTVIAGRGSAFGWPGMLARIQRRPWRMLSTIKWAAKAIRELHEGPFDHAVAHWAVPCGFPIATTGLGADTTLELVSHGADIRLLVALPSFAREAIVKKLVYRTEHWRFVSETLLSELCEALSTEVATAVQRIAHVRAASIEIPETSPRNPVPGFGRGQYAVSVGRLVTSKQVDRSIAWAAKHGIPLAIVGDGPHEIKLRIIAKKMGARVIWLGKLPRAETLSWIKDARALVMASRAEGLSTVVREATHFGTEVIDLNVD